MIKISSLFKKIDSFDKLASQNELMEKNAKLLNKINYFYKISQVMPENLDEPDEAKMDIIRNDIAQFRNEELPNLHKYLVDHFNIISRLGRNHQAQKIPGELKLILNVLNNPPPDTRLAEQLKLPDFVQERKELIAKIQELLSSFSQYDATKPAAPAKPRKIAPFNYNLVPDVIKNIKDSTEFMNDEEYQNNETIKNLKKRIDYNLAHNLSSDDLYDMLGQVINALGSGHINEKLIIEQQMNYLMKTHGTTLPASTINE